MRGPVLSPAPPTVHTPFGTVRRSLAVATAIVLTGCATGAPAPEDPPAEPDRGDRPPSGETEPEAPPSRLIEEAGDLLDRGRARRAYRLADSLYFDFRASGARDDARRSLRLAATARLALGDTSAAAGLLDELVDRFPDAGASEEARRLASLRVALGDDPGAVDVLLAHPNAWDESARELLRRAAGHLSIAELDRILDDPPAAAPADALSLLRRERERARTQANESRPVRIGLLLPASGRLASVGSWLREGITLALDSPPDGAPEVEVVEVDLAGPEGVERQVRGLLESDVAAVLGPIRSDQLAIASRAAGQRLVISSTANDGPAGPRPSYALWDRDRREVDAAVAVAEWLGEAVRPSGVGVMYPRSEMGRRSYLAFRRALGSAGGGVAAAVSFDPEATTVQAPIREVGAFAPRVVYAPAPGSSSILQLAPQLSYYGIRGTVVAGGPDWSRPSTFRRLEPSFSQLRLAPTYLDRSEGGGWSRFTDRYEREYRKSLGENVLPGLGHDAALLLLTALAETRPARPRAVARRFALLRDVAGATGRLTPEAATGTVRREVELRTLTERQLGPATAAEVRSWVEAASGLAGPHDRRRRAQALRAVRGSGIGLEGGSGGGDR